MEYRIWVHQTVEIPDDKIDELVAAAAKRWDAPEDDITDEDILREAEAQELVELPLDWYCD